jgi:hypothetical protein
MNIHERISFGILCMSLVFIFRAIDLSATEEDRRTVALTGARLLDGLFLANGQSSPGALVRSETGWKPMLRCLTAS